MAVSESTFCCPWVGKFFLVLLRLAIGWQLLYEGMYKLNPPVHEVQAWSAAGYLRNASGPLADRFRRLVDDDPTLPTSVQALQERWQRQIDLFASHYGFDEDQLASAAGELQSAVEKAAAELFGDADSQGLLTRYTAYQQKRQSGGFLTSSEQQRLTLDEPKLRQRVVRLSDAFAAQLNGLVSDEQRGRGEAPGAALRISWINQLVMYGQVVGGACLMLGLFSRLAALGCATMMVSFYLSMPPFPGLPGTTEGPSHYLYVNRNVIETLALLALSTTASGRWCGLDALVRGCVTRPIFGVGRNRG